MTDDRDLVRHLEEGGDALWNPATPPTLDLGAIIGAAPDAPSADATLPAENDDFAGSYGGTGAGRSARAKRRGWRRRFLPAGRAFTLGPGVLGGGALACLAAGILIGTQVLGSGSDPATTVATTGPSVAAVPDERVDLRPLDGAPARALAVANVYSSAASKRIDLRITGLPPLRNGTFYEVWALGKAGRMVSLGTVSVDAAGDGETSMRLPVSLRRFPVLDISLERADGNPAHSGRSLLRAPA